MRWPFGRKQHLDQPSPDARLSEQTSDCAEPPEVQGADDSEIQESKSPGGEALEGETPKIPAEPSPEMEGNSDKHNSGKRGWFARLREGLSKSSSRLSSGVSGIFTQRKIDDETLEELEDLLISADLGVAVARKITQNLGKSRLGKDITDEEIKHALAEEISAILSPVARPLIIPNEGTPQVCLMVGVNGSGKTTTIGKIAQIHKNAGRSLMLAAGDTFRAAAVEQLKIWGQRTNSLVFTRPEGSDPAGLAYDALRAAHDQRADLLLIDTAGRLHNRQELMDELAKVVRVLKKVNQAAPHQVILVLDATIGQNALAQVKAFKEMVDITGLIITKLDGTAKGGVVVALAQEFSLPIYAVGVGEGIEDLRDFNPHVFARALLGLQEPFVNSSSI